MRKSQRYLLAGSLGFVAMAVVTLAVLLVTVLNEGSSTTPTANSIAATTAPTATPTPILHVAPAQGWVNVPQTNFVYDLKFSTGHPLDGYACSGTISNGAETFTLHATHNGGLTWAAIPIPLAQQGQACTLVVNPANSNDIVAGALSCYVACDGVGILGWIRSLDGGKTWTPLHYSAADEATHKQVEVVAQWLFAGNDLYCYVTDYTQSGYAIQMPQPLGVSVNGGAFTWMDNAALATATHITNTNRLDPFVWKDGLYIYVLSATKIPQLIVTRDGGQTWNTMTPQFQGVTPPFVLPIAAETPTTLYISYYSQPQGIQTISYFQSTDGGQTWVPAPFTLPGKTNFAAITPDGTIFANTTSTLLCQAPGGTTWQPVATYIQSPTASPYISQSNLGLSWDNAGHPIADWAISGMYSSTQIAPFPQTQVLAYHAAACS